MGEAGGVPEPCHDMAGLEPTVPLENDFQFVLCEGCRQQSPDLKLLTCLHTLCLGCLRENKPVGQCPVCQAPIPQPDGIPDVDNVLFSSLQIHLSIYQRVISGAELLCDNCRSSSEYWCPECKEFLCTKCFETHQRYVKRENHEAKRVQDIRVGSPQEFLEGTRRTSSLSCPIPTHQNLTLSIYCKQCSRVMCCICALLDAAHSGQHCDVSTEARLRQDELAVLGQELEQWRGRFEASQAALQKEMERLKQAGSAVRELVKQRVEQLVRLIRHQEQELLALVERRQERGRKELEGELRRVDAVLRRMEAGKRLVEKMGLYATEQEVMDMQPFVKDALEELRRQRPLVNGELMLHEDFAECRARLRALTECIEGLQEAAPAPATMKNSHQVPLMASTPAKRKKEEGTSTLPSPVKMIKAEKDDDEGNTPVMPQEPNCLPQPHTSFSAPTMAASREGCLLNSTPGSSNEMHDSDSDLLNLGSDEEDSRDEELDPSLLDDMFEDGTSRDNSLLPICLQNTLDAEQGYVVFFDIKIWKNEIIHMVVVDKEKMLSVLIQPTVCFPNSAAKTNGSEVGLRDLLIHLSTIRRPILAAYGLWSLPFPTLLKNLTAIGMKAEFFSVVHGFMDVLPLIKEKIPENQSCKLENLANSLLWQDLSNCSTMESARATRDLCNVLEIDLNNRPIKLLSPANLESFMSLQPLLDKKLLTRPSAQTLASHGIGLPELHDCFACDPARGLRRMCALVNAVRHPSEKKVRQLSKIKAYFQQQPLAGSSQASLCDELQEATKTKQDC
ncbi:protein PML-like isoform X2 [Coturnix japonica]|uniref:Protein PML-like n=1 Tax=Coturnix japonica TaxID=93934 RepID=A0A8C2T5A9_COTJA|nr:protein PML-like isoform X2 [Coturnix japonica]